MRSLLLLLALPSAARSADPLGPGAGPWAVEEPSAHGLDKAALDDARDYIAKHSPTRGCLVVIKDGALVYESYTDNLDVHTAHVGHSETKTLGALTAGWAVSQGKLDLDADITQTYGVTSPKSYPVTSRQIMSQALNGADGPGEKWRYDTIGRLWINTMAKVVNSATGRKTSDIWQTELLKPLGLGANFTWPSPDSMWADGSKGTCRDWARVGQLMLNKGQWKGLKEPIVSADYIHELSTPQTRYAPYKNYSNPCYGLLTWLATPRSERGPGGKYPGECLVPLASPAPPSAALWEGAPTNLFFAAGALGQITLVDPDHSAVYVSMGESRSQNGVASVLYRGLCKALGYPASCQDIPEL